MAHGKYSNPKFDELMAKSREVVDAEERNRLYAQLVFHSVEDMPTLTTSISMLRLVWLSPHVGVSQQPAG